MKATHSTYRDWSSTINEATGRDCSALNDSQMDEVGMAAERASLEWGWAHASSNGEDDRAASISAAKQNVECCSAESENDLIGACVGIFFDDYGL